MFGWFGRKAAEPVRPFVPVWLQGEGEVGGFVRGYEAQLDEVYRKNPVGLRAVRLVSGVVGGLPLFGAEPALKLIGAEGLLEGVAAALLLHGNAYVQLIADGHDRPGELNLLRPERVSVATDAAGWPSAYVYRAGGKSVRIAKSDALGRRQLAHLKALNPADDHYDPDRDYQTGQMRASSGRGGARDERIELPAVLTGGQAKQLVEESLARRWRSGERIQLRLPPAQMELRPGDAIQLAGVSQAWTIRSISIEGMAVSVEAEVASVDVAALPADPGRAVSEPDVPVGRSELALFEMPSLSDAPDPGARVFLAASNDGRWKPLAVELQLGTEPLPAISLNRRAVVGRAETVLAAGPAMVLDELSSVTVRLANPAQLLLNADPDALMAGANLSLVGDELFQFGRAELLAPGTYRLSRLLRGRRGTEWAAAGHVAGETFCIIDPAAILPVELSPGAAGSMLAATAHGIGDTAPLPRVERHVTGEALRPPSPCHLILWRTGNELRAEWTRRSHRGWSWVDGVGVAADSFPETYRVVLTGPAGALTIDTGATDASFDVAQLPAETGQTLELSVAMAGPMALSHRVSASIII